MIKLMDFESNFVIKYILNIIFFIKPLKMPVLGLYTYSKMLTTYKLIYQELYMLNTC